MTTLIVGCGYLGRRVGRNLVARGEQVFGTTRSEEKAGELAAMGIEPVFLDVLDPRPMLLQPDRVLYCVGFDRTAGKSMRSVYVGGLKCILDLLPDGCHRFVYASSTGVYGQDDGSWVDEDSPTMPTQDSGKVVLDAEAEIRAWDQGQKSLIVRYVGLYGPGRLIGRASLRKNDSLGGDPDRWLNLIHIEDAASIAETALFHASPSLLPIYLAADDRPVRRREYYEAVALALGTSPPVFSPSHLPVQPGETNKRVTNRRIKEDLGIALRYSDISTGIASSLDESGT